MKIVGFLLAVAGALVTLIAAILVSSSYGQQMVATYILLVGIGLSVIGVSLSVVAASRKSGGHGNRQGDGAP
jgi:hypothetical protein